MKKIKAVHIDLFLVDNIKSAITAESMSWHDS